MQCTIQSRKSHESHDQRIAIVNTFSKYIFINLGLYYFYHQAKCSVIELIKYINQIHTHKYLSTYYFPNCYCYSDNRLNGKHQ